MNQPVRSHEVATDRILGELLETAKSVAPYSPDLDRLASRIETITVPQWRPSNAAEQVFSQRHHEFLGEILLSISPKASAWGKLFSGNGKVTPPTPERLSKAHLDLARYLDETALSLKAIAGEEKSIASQIEQIAAFRSGLELFQNAIAQNTSGQVLERLTKAIGDKDNDLVHLHAVYTYAKGSYAMARDSLQTSGAYARTLQESITLNIKAAQAGRQDRNLLIPSTDNLASIRPPQGNRIEPLVQPTDPAAELARLAGEVGRSLEHQKNTITQMDENTRDINNLSQPR